MLNILFSVLIWYTNKYSSYIKMTDSEREILWHLSVFLMCLDRK